MDGHGDGLVGGVVAKCPSAVEPKAIHQAGDAPNIRLQAASADSKSRPTPFLKPLRASTTLPFGNDKELPCISNGLSGLPSGLIAVLRNGLEVGRLK